MRIYHKHTQKRTSESQHKTCSQKREQRMDEMIHLHTKAKPKVLVFGGASFCMKSQLTEVSSTEYPPKNGTRKATLSVEITRATLRSIKHPTLLAIRGGIASSIARANGFINKAYL